MLSLQLELLGIQTAQVAEIIQSPGSRKRATDRSQRNIDIRLQLLSSVFQSDIVSPEEPVDLPQVVVDVTVATALRMAAGVVEIARHVIQESLFVGVLVLREKQKHDDPRIDPLVEELFDDLRIYWRKYSLGEILRIQCA